MRCSLPLTQEGTLVLWVACFYFDYICVYIQREKASVEIYGWHDTFTALNGGTPASKVDSATHQWE